LLNPLDEALSVDAARSFLGLEFPKEDRERMQALAARARAGALTPAEQEEVQVYERVGNLLALLKSKARQRLKRNPATNGPAAP
jgi:hypothetical protein